MSSENRLPEELWRRILEVGVVESSTLNYKDLCRVSISCRFLHRLSNDDALWSRLLSTDFPSSSSSSTTDPNATSKSVYEFRFEKDRASKLLAHRRAVLRIESRISERSKKLQDLEGQLAEETKKMKATLAELSSLRKVRQASVALNVWQPEVIRARQRQIVQNCSVSVDSRINVVEMELKLCKQQIAGFGKAHRDEKRRLEAVKEQLCSLNYHPLQNNKSTNDSLDGCRIKRKKFKTCIDSECETLANTHVNVQQDLKDVKLWQVHTLLKGLEKIAASADIPMLVCGDFNSVPGSAPHALLALGKVDAMHPDLAVDPLGILRPATKLSHTLPLVSAYSSFARAPPGLGYEQQKRRVDQNTNEPLFTNCTRDFICTHDYIFYSADTLTVESLLELLDEESLRKDTALPSPEWSSDHIALLAEFRCMPRTRR